MSTNWIVIIFVGICILFGGCKAQKFLSSQEKKKSPKVKDVHFNKKTEKINVFYDLQAESTDSEFEITLLLSLGENKTYSIDSTSTYGDIGKGVLPGKNKKISWNVLDDFPEGINGKQIQFIVEAQKVSNNNNKKWIYITSGALLLGAGAILGYKLFQSGETGLPGPPSRPANN